jgi:hypothetical protein
MVYPALLPLKRTPRLPVVEWTDAPADLNGLVRFPERHNLVSAHVPSHFKRSLPHFSGATVCGGQTVYLPCTNEEWVIILSRVAYPNPLIRFLLELNWGITVKYLRKLKCVSISRNITLQQIKMYILKYARPTDHSKLQTLLTWHERHQALILISNLNINLIYI